MHSTFWFVSFSRAKMPSFGEINKISLVKGMCLIFYESLAVS